ncbi:amidohydrolase [Colwelliaceae bacterium BS250]
MKKRTLSLALSMALPMAFMSSVTLANADLIFTNGDIVTVTGENDRAQAVAIKDGNIIAVGSNKDVLKEKGSKTEVRDLAGKTLLPGFIDSHGHFVNYLPLADSLFVYPEPMGTSNSIAIIKEQLKAHLAQPGLDKSKMHIAFGYDDSILKEARHPTVKDIDSVTEGFTVCMAHISGHLLSCNSAGLELLGYNNKSENPSGGIIHRDENGELTGVLEESATYPVFGHMTVDPAKLAEAATKAQEMFTKYGITTAQEGLATKATMGLMQHLSSANLLDIDILTYVKWYEFDEILKTAPLGEYVNGLKFAGMKITTDGSPQGKTAYLSTPYFEVPHNHSYTYHGYPIMPQDELNEYVSTAYKNNAQLIIHSNGDASSDMVLDAVDYAIEKNGERDHRTTVIHGQTMRLDQIKKAAERNMMTSFFVAHTYFWGDWHRESVLGEWRASNISPTGWANEHDMKFTLSMDAPVLFPDQLMNMWTAVNRITRTGVTLGENHKITPYQALEAVTIHAAYQNFEEDSKGTIEVGKRADLVVLADNPLTVDTMKIKDITVLETIKDGKTIWSK